MVMKFDQLEVEIYDDAEAMGRAGAEYVRTLIEQAIAERGSANVILATGNSQLAFLKALCSLQSIEWNKVRIFHMDEYIGISEDHPASFVRYIRERVVNVVHPLAFFPIRGDADDPQAVCDEYEALLREYPADVCCMGIGENGHIAFNDPPVADFADAKIVKTVELDEACRRQQVNDGCFPRLADVPRTAMTMTIPALMSGKALFAIVPGARKKPAVRQTLHGPISTACPASILRRHPDCTLFVDREAYDG